MNSFRYPFAQFLKNFGVTLKDRRMKATASEMHLLQEAEIILGLLCWEHCESIEELSPEYWPLRKLAEEREQITKNILSPSNFGNSFVFKT